MSYIEKFFGSIFIIMLLCIMIPTVLIPFYRLLTFKNKVATIKDKYFKNKFEGITSIILLPILIVFTIIYISALISSIGQDIDYLSLLRLLRPCIPLYIICNLIARLPKQCIYKEGVKTDSYYVKWNEIENIDEDENDLKIYFGYRYVFFKIRHIYIIKDCSAEIKELLYSFNSKKL